MKKSIKFFAVCFIAAVAFTSCREQEPGTTTTIIKEKEVTTEKAAEKTPEKQGILERAANKVDSRVNKEADKVIDKINN